LPSFFPGADGNCIGHGHAAILADGGKYGFNCHFYDRADPGRSCLA
jgi:hypothetical protein